jgi:hypothetical protein
MINLHRLKNNMKNEGTTRLMIGDIPELQEVAQREVVVGEVRTVTPNFLLHHLLYMLQCNELVLKVLLNAR